MTAPIKIGGVDIVAPPGCTVAPNASPPPVAMSPALAESATHWHMKHREAEAALAAMTAERAALCDAVIRAFAAGKHVSALGIAQSTQGLIAATPDARAALIATQVQHERAELRADLMRVAAERDEAVEALAEREMCSTCEAIHDALWSEAHRERSVLEMVDALRTRVTAERDALTASYDATVRAWARAADEIAADLRMARHDYAGVSEDIAEIVRIVGAECSDCGPVTAVRRVVTARTDVVHQLDEEARGHNDARVKADATVANLRATLAARDAQEGDRIAAWAEADELHYACVRCWYPCHEECHGPDGKALCDACKADDDRDAAGAVAEVAR